MVSGVISCCRFFPVLNDISISKKIVSFFLPIVLFFSVLSHALARDAERAATIVTASGLVEVLSGDMSVWRPAVNGMTLRMGESIRTGDDGRVALLLSDETMIQLNRGSFLTLKKVSSTAGWLRNARYDIGDKANASEYELTAGQLWMRNKNKDVRIDIRTPLVTAGIRGTELDIRIVPDGTTFLSVLEGHVSAESSQRQLVVNAMEQVVVRSEGLMEKRALVSKQGHLQWILHLPSLLTAEVEKGVGRGEGPSTRRILLEKARTALFDGEVGAAQDILSDLTQQAPTNPAGWTLYAQSLLLTGENTKALAAAKKAVTLSPDSVSALLTLSQAHQSLFELKEALEFAEKAVSVAPENDTAHIACARILFAMDDMKGAGKHLAAVADTGSPSVQSLLGFIHFRNNKTGMALSCFEKAIIADSHMAEAYMGLALSRMRMGQKSAAVEAISKAMLLQPRRSLFLSYWGKMLHEMGRAQKALEILDQAAAMDTSDPTPWLYRAHILEDLNRSGEAIEAYQKAVRRNDNRAVYRSRFLLDKDLAVQNISMARIFWKLGMGDWGGFKAWKSIKLDYANSAAHDFQAWIGHYTSGGRGITDTSEWLKAFLFKPVNDNTFSSFRRNTLFFEQPDLGGVVSLQYGTQELKLESMNLYGAVPGQNISFQVDLQKYIQDQWRGGLYEEGYLVRPAIKWDVTPRDHLSFRIHLETVDYGDNDTVTQYDVPRDPLNRSEGDWGQVEAGYFREMTPNANLLVHVRHRFENDYEMEGHQRFLYGGDMYDSYSEITLEEPYTTFQALQLLNVGDRHQIMLGTFQYWSDRNYAGDDEVFLDYSGYPVSVISSRTDSGRTRRQESYYIQDVWQLSSSLTLEGALYAERIENAYSPADTVWSDSYWHPRVGAIYSPTPAHTLTAAYSRHLDTLQFAAHIDPIDVAGQPLASFYEGGVFEEWAVGWTYEWLRGCLVTRGFDLFLTVELQTDASGALPMVEYENEYQGVEISFNQLVKKRFGLNLGYILIDVTQDGTAPEDEGENHNFYGRLSYLNPSGFYAGVMQQYFITRYDDNPEKDGNDFPVTNLYVGYELPKKWGDIRLDVLNLFDEKFNGEYLSDLSGLWPELTVRLQAQFFF